MTLVQAARTLTARQARKALEAYKTAFVGEVYWLAELVDFGGWKALGHSSAEAMGEELGVSRSTLWRQVEQGRVVRAVSQGDPKLLAKLYVSQRQAAVLAPVIETVGEPIRHRIEEGEDPAAVFADVVEQLSLPLAEPESPGAVDQPERARDVAQRATKEAPSDDTPSGEVQPPDSEPETVAADETGSSPSPAGSGSSRGAQGPMESGEAGAAPVAPAQEQPDPPLETPAPEEGSESSTADSGPSQEAASDEDRLQTPEEWTHSKFDEFFSADPDGVAAMDDYDEGRRRSALMRKWFERYEIAVRGVSATGIGAARTKADESGCRHTKKTVKGSVTECDSCGAFKVGNKWIAKVA